MKTITLASILCLFVAGCSVPPTNPVEQTPTSVKSATVANSKLVKVEDGRTLNIDTVLPTFSSALGLEAVEIKHQDGSVESLLAPRVDAVGGGASYEMTVPLGKNQYATFRTATVLGVKAIKYVALPDGTVQIDGLEITSDAAKANESVAVIYEKLAPIWIKWSEDKRAMFETLVNRLADLGVSWGQAAVEAIKLLRSATPAGTIVPPSP